MTETAPGVKLHESWRAPLADEFASPYMAALRQFLVAEKAAGKHIYPKGGEWFRALDLTPLDTVRVVILGQDPYHGEGQAHGLCFSVRPGVRPPPSLVNIYKELHSDLGIARPGHGFLEHWAEQGVLLLNSVLTVQMGLAASHKDKGWERFTDAVIRLVAAKEEPVVFLLWGSYAQKKAAFIPSVEKGGRHLVLKAAHPSPLSAHNGFLGCRHFSKANAFLEARGMKPIDWALPAIG
ncbi:uracil-DNA glycosylase [Sphingomonas sp. AP4-R1]|uniref:uracil-DNA glycosylase n=1 Tax=Sphingomonas sp. AP4-R1 TaxID=2735134 RepID=UPI0014935AF3|nr:uracil-DNA glycosylase [Sphingomonas sp. AP4-R1]QJU56923.1 uracil-DNA glycosylase [Sphingomonas sp. AP4-R1]